MANVYADANGNLLGADLTDAEAALQNNTRPGATQTVTFDEAANAALIADLLANWNGYKVAGGQLQKSGVAQTPAADSQTKTDLMALLNGAAAAVSTNTTFVGLASPTNAQTLAQVQALSRQNTQIIKQLVRVLNKLYRGQ